MHPQTLAFVGLFDLLMCGISLHTKEGIKVFLVSGGVRPQEGLAAAQKEREIVPHRVSDVCLCVSAFCVCKLDCPCWCGLALVRFLVFSFK